MYCFQCGKYFKESVNYCTECGMKMPVASKKKRTETRAERRRREKGQSAGRGVRIPVSFVFAGIAGLLILGLLALSTENPSVSTAGNMTGTMPIASGAATFSTEVLAIAGQFRCPCGRCTLNLADCDCTEPNEAIVAAFTLKYGIHPNDSY